MTQFWRLFTSDHVQNFVDSVSIPTSEELIETYRSQFNDEVQSHKEKIVDFFNQKVTA